MTRLTDLPPAQAKRLAELECPDFETRPWVPDRRCRSAGSRSSPRPALSCAARTRFAGAMPITGSSRPTPSRTTCCQPYLDQFRPHRVSGRLECRLPARPAAGAGRRGHDRLGGGDPLFVHGRHRPGRRWSRYARELAGRLKQDAGRRRHSPSRLTALHARRERAGALSGGRGHRDGRDQPDPAADREHQAAARAVGAVRAGPAVRPAERPGFQKRVILAALRLLERAGRAGA